MKNKKAPLPAIWQALLKRGDLKLNSSVGKEERRTDCRRTYELQEANDGLYTWKNPLSCDGVCQQCNNILC